MNEEMVQKKVYPSQLNTKTISARIPVNDYVSFLKESLESGISLNDWLLLKIYGNQQESVSGINPENITISESDYFRKAEELGIEYGPNEYLEIDDIFQSGDANYSKDDLLNLLIAHATLMVEYRELIKARSTVSLSNIKDQLAILVKRKFDDLDDRKAFRKELFELLKELE